MYFNVLPFNTFCKKKIISYLENFLTQELNVRTFCHRNLIETSIQI